MTPPDLIPFTAFGGDWARYENELYDIFINEIARGGLTLRIPTIARMYSDLMPRSVPI
jgi:hypothetical protein